MSDNSNNYPRALYRPAEEDSGHEVHEVWGHKVHMLIVGDEDEEKQALGAGWQKSPPPEKGPKDFAKAGKDTAKSAHAKA